MKKINKHFVSDIDTKCAEFDAINPKSASQKAEIAKYKRITRLRDKKTRLPKAPEKLWEGF